MDEDQLTRQIARACVAAKVNPAIVDTPGNDDSEHPRYDRLPEGCPIPEMQVRSVLRWNATAHKPECWSITVMIERWIGSNSLWAPLEINGPNMPRDWRDKSSPQGWRINFDEKGAVDDYDDLKAVLTEDGWWPTLEEAWAAIPEKYTGYYKHWRQESDCYLCSCTGVYLHNLIMLPCPYCRTTPDLTYGYQHLMWVPAHTPERLPHAEVGKSWRWRYGKGYVVQQVLGNPQMAREHPGWEFVHVGLKRHEAVDNPNWRHGDDYFMKVADFDFASSKAPAVLIPMLPALAVPLPTPLGWNLFARLYRRIMGWFDNSPTQPALVQGMGRQVAGTMVDMIATMLSNEREEGWSCDVCGSVTPHVLVDTVPPQTLCAPCLEKHLVTFREMEHGFGRTG